MAEISAKKRIWGWWWFDWASQPYHTLLVTFVFGPFFAVAAAAFFLGTGLDEKTADAEAQALWSWANTAAGLFIAAGAPIMGAMADSSGRRRPWIMWFSAMYVIGAGALWYTDPAGSNSWTMLAFFALGFIGAEFALIFINSQLPDLVSEEEVGRVSGSGFAFGYLGGLAALAIMLVMFVEQPGGRTIAGLAPGLGLLDASAYEGTRFVGPFTAAWYALFMIPYFLWVHDRPTGKRISFGAALGIIRAALKSVVKKRSLGAYLLGSMFYRDALNGLYAFGGVYAALVLDWSLTLVGIFGIVALISSALFSWLGGKLDKALGPKPVIVAAILVLIGVIVVILFMNREMIFGIPLAEGSKLPDIVFFACGVLIGGMGGTLQSASRTMMVRHSDPHAPTESFGLYGLSGRATAFMAPFLIGLVTTMTGSARLGVSPLIGLFLLGLILLIWVKPEGERG
ncbi:MAG: MFS transporter [Maritimibacter sp.]|nr:MFS transporter [Maritimibacter sp.]